MPSPTRGKSVSCQQIDFGGPEGSYFRTVPISQRLRYFDSVVFVFFSTRLFDRRMFSSKDCFTGQSPGIGHDASHLYTGGSRMCRRGPSPSRSPYEGAGSLVWWGGLVTSARISLMEGVLPSRLWQPDKSWSRRDAAKACMAACVSRRGLAGFGVGEQPQESCGFITPTSSNFNPKDNKATSPIPEEFRVGAFLVPPHIP